MRYFPATLLCALLLAPIALAQESAPKTGLKVSVDTDRENAIYKTGETAKFIITVTRDGKPATEGVVTYAVDDFITDQPTKTDFPKGKAELNGEPIVVTATSATPTFLRCVVRLQNGKKQLSSIAGAGFSPEMIEPSTPEPDDFTAFWAAEKKKLAEIPFEAKLTPVKFNDASVVCFDVQVPCVGAPVSGYFAKPESAKPKSLPIILTVHGAGVRSSSLPAAAQGAKGGMLSMDINAHGIPNGKPGSFYADLSRGELANYRIAGRESRDTIYFKEMYLRIVRAIDFLTAQPEWDGRTVVVMGHSQGGGQALVAGGIDDRVTMIATGVPAICDHSGRVIDRINGWPKIVPLTEDGKPEPKSLEAAKYIDAVNFARHCKADAIMSVGFIDGVCPPASCYAAYNVLQGKKQMLNEPHMGHAAPAHIQAAMRKALMQHAQAATAQ